MMDGGKEVPADHTVLQSDSNDGNNDENNPNLM